MMIKKYLILLFSILLLVNNAKSMDGTSDTDNSIDYMDPGLDDFLSEAGGLFTDMETDPVLNYEQKDYPHKTIAYTSNSNRKRKPAAKAATANLRPTKVQRLAAQSAAATAVSTKKDFTCYWNNCGRKFTKEKEFYSHVDTHDINGRTCLWKDCNKKLSNKKNLKIHLRGIHKGIKHKCLRCNQKFNDSSSLSRHIKNKHRGVTYKCSKCDQKFTDKSSLNRHTKNKHGNIKYKCSKCDQEFSAQRNLTKHIKTKHEGIKYKCSECDQELASTSGLNRHIKNKHKGIKYKCPECDREFTQQGNLKRHINKKHP